MHFGPELTWTVRSSKNHRTGPNIQVQAYSLPTQKSRIGWMKLLHALDRRKARAQQCIEAFRMDNRSVTGL